MNSLKNNKVEKKEQKEILNNIFKQLLEQRLTRLEKRNITEVKTFQLLSNETQNLILALEDMANGVRKQISIQRQKYINNNQKSIKSNPKSKVIPQSLSTRRLAKRLDSKSYDRFHVLQTDINSINSRNNKSQILGNKSKSKLKRNISSKIAPKVNDMGRKTVGNLHNNNNKTGTIPHSKPVKNPISPFSKVKIDPLNKTMGNKPNSKTKRKDSAQRKKSVGKLLKSKEKVIKKTEPKATNNKEKLTIKIETNNLHNINSLEKFDSNNMDDSRLNVLDIFGVSKKGGNKEGNLNINKEINKDKKNNKSGFLATLSKEFEKVGTIKMDEQLIKDSLLVSNVDGENLINIDNLMRESTLKEFEMTNNSDIKNKNNINDSINKDNKWSKASDKVKALNSSLIIYNKLKRAKVTFLEEEKDFDLIFKDSKIEDMDLNANLDNELNTTQNSEQMSLEEKLESNLDIISRYLDLSDIGNLMLANKECFKTIINYLISKNEITIELLQDEIKRLKEYNPNINFDNLKIKPFKLSVNSMRAISLLNASSGNNILRQNNEQLNKKEIILVYTLYFVAIGLKKNVLILNDSQKIEYMQNHFKQKCNGQNIFGKVIESEINGKIFDDKIISSLFNISKGKLDIISPNYFQKINKDIAIFVFIIKDLLEHIGLLGSHFLKPDKEFILLNSRLNANKAILDELNKIEENIY